MPLDKPLESVTEADLQMLLDDAVAEGKLIDYKESLPSDTYEAKRDFLADVSSFANASGGHLVFGIREEQGVPVQISGLPGIDPDAQILRLESMIRDSIDPRILGILTHPVPLSGLGVAIVMRIPRSWQQPHVVTYRRHWRFYSRNSAGKYPLDVSEVRAAFALSETLAERVRLFRSERLGKVVAQETPADLGEGAKLVLHIVPFAAFDPSAQLDMSLLGQEATTLAPIGGATCGHRYSLDGPVVYGYSGSPPRWSYVQVFRSGAIEAAGTLMLTRRDPPSIPSVDYERLLLQAVPQYLAVQERLGVAPPVFVMLTLLGVLGYVMAVSPHLDAARDFRQPIDRDAVLVPEVIVEAFDAQVAEAMRPIFDAVWNAAGWPRSLNYDDSGQWCQGPNCRH